MVVPPPYLKNKKPSANPVHVEREPFLSSLHFTSSSNSTLNSMRHNVEHEEAEESMLDACIQLLFFDTMLSLLRMVPNCLFFLSASHPVFNRALLLAESEEAHRDFLLRIGETNAFHAFTDSLLKIETSPSSPSSPSPSCSSAFFLRACERLELLREYGEDLVELLADDSEGDHEDDRLLHLWR